MPKVNCAIWRKRYDCEECAFYQAVYTEQPACEFHAMLGHLNELVQNVRLLVGSNEGQRELAVQQLRSSAFGKPTPELLRMTGIVPDERAENALAGAPPRVDLPARGN